MTENPNEIPFNYQPVFTELQSMNRRLSDLDEDVNRIDRDLSNDRKDIEQLKISQASITNQLNSIMEVLTRFQVKTKDAVKDAVSEANIPLEKQMKQFVSKKIVHVKIPSEKLSIKLKRWFGLMEGVK